MKVEYQATLNRAEEPGEAVVTIPRDGFLDDSFRGDWHCFVYKRHKRDEWRIEEARRAFRRWRSDVENFRDVACP